MVSKVLRPVRLAKWLISTGFSQKLQSREELSSLDLFYKSSLACIILQLFCPVHLILIIFRSSYLLQEKKI